MNPGEEVQPIVVPQGSVIITPNDMYKEIQEIGRKVDHVATVVDPAISNLREIAAQNRGDIRAQDARITTTEKTLSWMKGIGAAISLLMTSGLVTLLVSNYHH